MKAIKVYKVIYSKDEGAIQFQGVVASSVVRRRRSMSSMSCMSLLAPPLLAPPEPVKSKGLPSTDLMGPPPSGEYLFVVVDYYRRYVDVKMMRTAPVQKINTALDDIFSRNGLPRSIKTDNQSIKFLSCQYPQHSQAQWRDIQISDQQQNR